jgi:serine phosphatase RsbU (regulator of sigma subunit)/anti-sigma regulatory factor (Ser/Thr protein kinase)/ABC-type transporter Mla MlaB component
LAAPDSQGVDQVVGAAAAVRAAFDQLSVIVVCWSGEDHKIAAMNAAARRYTRRSGVIGRPFGEAFPELAGQQVLPMLDRVYATGEPQTGSEWRIQLERGTGQPEDTFVDFTVAPWRASDGTVIGLIGTGTDVTARVLQRQAVQRQAAEAERWYRAARDVVAELQETLLSTAVPVLPAVQVAARYLVASDDQAAGGDWFDALPLADGTVALVVGDVVGHGVAASAAMGQLRAVLNELLYGEPDLARALARADAFACRVPALWSATMAVAVLDPAAGTLRYSTCGHPPPLIIGPDGTTRVLAGSGDGPLGTGSSPRLATETLRPGELILLYTDGLVERPRRSLADGITELAQVAADAVTRPSLRADLTDLPADRVCQLTVELLARSGYADDVTTLAAQLLAAPVPSLHLDLPADIATVRLVREHFRRWLSAAGPVDDDVIDLQLAVTEIVTNAVEHAYPPGQPGRLLLDAELGPDGFLNCKVTDHGQWRPPGPEAGDRGQGLMIAGHVVDELTVHHPRRAAGPATGGGTVVMIRHRLRKAAFLASEPSTSGPAQLPGLPFAVTIAASGPDNRAEVCGPVDITSASQLARRLLAACRGGTVPLTVDLTEVTQLASAGVAVLHQLARQLAAHQHTLSVQAPRASPAREVLELVRLPYLSVA